MKFIVTGRHGYIGRHLEEALQEQGHVWACARPEIVFHLAAVARHKAAWHDWVRCFRTNIVLTAQVLEEAKRTEARKVVVASSNVVYGADSPYRASKLAMELVCDVYQRVLKVQCLRPAYVYGGRMKIGDTTVIPAMWACAMKHGFVEVVGDGLQQRDFIHVRDVVDAFIAAASMEDSTRTVDVCTGVTTQILEVARMFGVPVKFLPKNQEEIACVKQDPTPAYQEWGWLSKISLSEGMGEVLSDITRSAQR